MNKFFILCMLAVVAIAATNTNAACEKDIGVKNCKACAFSKYTKKACKDKVKANDLVCTALVECYKEVKAADEKKAKKAAKALTDKYNKFCPTEKAKCTDRDQRCKSWAARTPDECTKNPDWMLPNCAMSCCPVCTGKNTLKNTGTCPPKGRKDLCVTNTNAQCHSWFKNKECTKNKKWMRSNCMQSCCATCRTSANKCPTVKETCANKYAKPNAKKGQAKCVEWAKNGECKSNPNWMNSNCSKECCAVCAAKAPVAGQPVTQPVIRTQPVITQPARQIIQQPVYQPIQQPVYQPIQQPIVRQQAPVVRQQAPIVRQQAPVVRQQAPVVQQQPFFGSYLG